MGQGYSVRKERRAKLERLMEEKRVQPEAMILEDVDGENEKPVVPPETPGRVTEEKRPREANQKSKNKISGSKSKELSSKNKEDKKSKKSSKTLKEEKFEAIEEQEAEEEAGDAENEEEGEEEGEEEDDGSGEFDELSKVHVPLKMKKFVRWDSQKPSSQQNFSEEASSNSHVDSSKKKISIKTLTQLHKPAANDTNRGQIKRKTFSKKHLEETPSITKSELKRIKIRPLPKPKAVSNPKETSVKDPPVKNLSVVKEEPKQPKEDSFFKNFDASNLDFSKYKASQESWNKQKKDPKLLTTDSYPTFLDNEHSKQKSKAFKGKNNLEISPIVTSDEDSDSEQDTSEIDRNIAANDNREYNVPFDWGDSGQVEMRTVKYHLAYIPSMKAIKVKKSDTTYLRSMLRWQRGPTYYDFIMQDLETIDLKNGANSKIGVPEIKFRVDFHGNFLGSTNTKDIAHEVINRVRLQMIKSRPKAREQITADIWKQKMRLVHTNLSGNIEKVWNTVIGSWACDLQSVKDPDDSGHLQDIKEVKHNEKDCYLMNSGDMNDSNLMRNHISRKVADSEIYKELCKSPNFVLDPLNAWGMRTENAKVRRARKRYEDFKLAGKEEDYFNTETVKDLVNFYALDKYEVSSILVEADNCRPHIINKDKATRIVFESYDGAYIQIEQEMDMVMLLWDSKKREDYFYKEVSKFRESTKVLFKGIITNLMRMRNSPLRFIPKDPNAKPSTV